MYVVLRSYQRLLASYSTSIYEVAILVLAELSNNLSRVPFLISCMNLFGAENFPKVESTGFADDEVIPDEYKGMVYAARKLGIVKGVEKENELFFCPDRAVTWSEAAVILNNVIGYEPANADNASWSSAAVCAMRELGVFGYESDIGTLTKSETADILYSVSCMIYE